MPYKNKTDRTEAVRRHRAKKKERIQAGERLEKKLTQFLTDLGFNTIDICFIIRHFEVNILENFLGVRARARFNILGTNYG